MEQGMTFEAQGAKSFADFVAERFGGKLTNGSHTPNGAACFHEAINVFQGKDWSDDTTGTLSLIALNDAPWSSDAARTSAMLPLGPIVLAWPSWSPERRQAWSKAVAEGVIRRILPPTLQALAERVPAVAPDLVAAALRCETEGSASAARSAESAAGSAASAAASAAESAARSAESAARSAESAAGSAASAAASAAESAAWSGESAARSAESAARSAARSADVPLQTLCAIMVEAALAGDSVVA